MYVGRGDVAVVCTQALLNEKAHNKSFEVYDNFLKFGKPTEENLQQLFDKL